MVIVVPRNIETFFSPYISLDIHFMFSIYIYSFPIIYQSIEFILYMRLFFIINHMHSHFYVNETYQTFPTPHSFIPILNHIYTNINIWKYEHWFSPVMIGIFLSFSPKWVHKWDQISSQIQILIILKIMKYLVILH